MFIHFERTYSIPIQSQVYSSTLPVIFYKSHGDLYISLGDNYVSLCDMYISLYAFKKDLRFGTCMVLESSVMRIK